MRLEVCMQGTLEFFWRKINRRDLVYPHHLEEIPQAELEHPVVGAVADLAVGGDEGEPVAAAPAEALVVGDSANEEARAAGCRVLLFRTATAKAATSGPSTATAW